MIIQEGGSSKNIWVGDIETLAGLIDFGFYNPDTGVWKEFQISEFKNELYEFVDFYINSQIDYVVGYNYVGFDAQVIQYVINNYNAWADLTNLEIIRKVYSFAQSVIERKRYKMFSMFREIDFSVKVLDVFTMLGLDNEARMTS